VTDRGKPLYMIGVVADMLNVHPQTFALLREEGTGASEPDRRSDAHVLDRGRR